MTQHQVPPILRQTLFIESVLMPDPHSASLAPNAPVPSPSGQPMGATAVLVLADGSIFWGRGVGAESTVVGEVCFNTSITGYQEIMTDPSYAGQLITFTFPHIGNVGTTPEDVETDGPSARGVILSTNITDPSNFRSVQPLSDWLSSRGLVGITGLDTRALTRRIRDGGAPNGVIAHSVLGAFDLEDLKAQAAAWPGLNGMDLAKDVTTAQTYTWTQGVWALGKGFEDEITADKHVVVVDFGVKRNILRCLASQNLRLTVVSAETSAEDILAHNPDGVFLSNGPGDPAATGVYAVPMIQSLLEHKDLPIFGICLGHQMLAIALGAKTQKMHQGHRGANQPVQDLETGVVEITSQNHGFVVQEPLPAGVTATHRSLFDGVLEGLKLEGRPVFSVQYHPEASPGPQDSHYLFKRFRSLLDA